MNNEFDEIEGYVRNVHLNVLNKPLLKTTWVCKGDHILSKAFKFFGQHFRAMHYDLELLTLTRYEAKTNRINNRENE